MSNAICKVCDYDAECIYDGKPMCYLCRENSAKAKREQQKEQTVTLELTDREANIVRHALALYAEQGANGCTTECWNIHSNIVTQQVANDIEADEYNDDDGMTDAEADADTLASAGWGTDEDYGYYGGDE